MSNDAFDTPLKSILDQHHNHGIMTIDLSSDSGISLLRGYLGDAHSLGMRQSAEIFERVQQKK